MHHHVFYLFIRKDSHVGTSPVTLWLRLHRVISLIPCQGTEILHAVQWQSQKNR